MPAFVDKLKLETCDGNQSGFRFAFELGYYAAIKGMSRRRDPYRLSNASYRRAWREGYEAGLESLELIG